MMWGVWFKFNYINMNFNGLINSRHREQVVEDLLNLGGNVQQDFLSIPQSEKTYGVSSTGVFEFGCDVTLSNSLSNTQGLLGYTQLANSNTRYGLYLGQGGVNISFLSATSLISTSITPYLGQRINIKCGFYDVAPQGRIYINNVLVASATTFSRPSNITSIQEFFIGAFGSAIGNLPQSNLYFDGKLHSFFIDGETWVLSEGSGFNTFSDLGTTAFGQTSNSGGLSYWNSTVWDSE